MIGSDVLHHLTRGRPTSVAPGGARSRQSPIKERTSLGQSQSSRGARHNRIETDLPPCLLAAFLIIS